MTTRNDDFAQLRAEYDAEKAAALDRMAPECRGLHELLYPSFAAWLRDRDITPPERDLTDPYLADRFKQYVAFREGELGPMGSSGRASVEPYFITFDDWLAQEETHERLYPSKSRRKNAQSKTLSKETTE